MYEERKDKVLSEWKFPLDEGVYLRVSVRQYNDGPPKLQIGPREYRDRAGEVRPGKVGRLSRDEVAWLREIIEDVLNVMSRR